MNKSYYAVIFTNKQTNNLEGNNDMADTMEHLAQKQTGYIGFESAKQFKKTWYKVRICKVEREYEFNSM